MYQRTARANGRRSKVRAFVEHVFAHQKARMGLFVRTIGIARARAKIGMANRLQPDPLRLARGAKRARLRRNWLLQPRRRTGHTTNNVRNW